MAYSQSDIDKIQLVAEWTDIKDDALIFRALQAKNGDVEQVANEFYEGMEKVSLGVIYDHTLS